MKSIIKNQLFLIFLINLSFGLPAQQGISDAQWIALNGLNINGMIRKQVWVNNNLYIAGEFTNVAGVTANRIAKWDGKSWMPLDKGVNGLVTAMAADKAGTIYIGGKFDSAGGIPAMNIARWDGTKWSAMGKETYKEVHALVVDKNNTLFVGGSFLRMENDSLARNIAQWNGTQWVCIGAGTRNLQSSLWYVTSLAIDSLNRLYIGGSVFSITCDICQNAFAMRWDSKTWTNLYFAPGVKSGSAYAVDEIAVNHKGTVYLSGSDLCARTPGDSGWTVIQKGWWHSAIAFDDSDNVFTLTTDDRSNVILEKWNGFAWAQIASSSRVVNSLTFDASGKLYAAGDFLSLGGSYARNLAVWDKRVWSPVLINGIDHPPSSCGVNGKGTFFIGGRYTTAFGMPADSAVIAWDGKNWTILPAGPVHWPLCMAFDAAGNLYTADGLNDYVIGKWDGQKWTSVGGKTSRIFSMALDASGNLYAGGDFSSIGAGSGGECAAANIAKWNGTSWSALGGGFGYAVRKILVLPSGEVIASGYYSETDSAGYIKKWDGASWRTLGRFFRSGRSPYCKADCMVADQSGNVYLAGIFDTINGVPCHNIASWNGNKWTSLNNETLRSSLEIIYDMAIDSLGSIYVIGKFSTAGSVSAMNIARWDGKTWSGLGSGINIQSESYLTYDKLTKRLYIAGDFSHAGGKFSPYIAVCDLSNSNPIMRPLENGFSQTPLRFTIAHSTLLLTGSDRSDRISIFSLSGRNLLLSNGSLPVKLNGLAPQPLIITVHRKGAFFSSKVVLR